MFRRNLVFLWIGIIILSGLFFMASNLEAALPDTGQTLCYDNTQEIECPAPGEPFYGKTKIDSQNLVNSAT